MLGQIDFQCFGATFRQTAQVEQRDVLRIKAIDVGWVKEELHLPANRMFHRVATRSFPIRWRTATSERLSRAAAASAVNIYGCDRRKTFATSSGSTRMEAKPCKSVRYPTSPVLTLVRLRAPGTAFFTIGHGHRTPAIWQRRGARLADEPTREDAREAVARRGFEQPLNSGSKAPTRMY